MKPEDKELLLKDLLARLPYGVKVLWKGDKGNSDRDYTLSVNHIRMLMGKHNMFYLRIKPYLRPMSSMTEEEKEELNEVTVINCNEFEGCSTLFDEEGFDWLNAHHFDYRGLIERGLALEAPEGMYNLKLK